MQVKVFKFDKNGRVSFTQEELEKLLNEVYNGGYWDGKRSNNYWTWTSPYYTWSNTSINSASTLTAKDTNTTVNSPNITWTTTTNSSDNTITAAMNTSTNDTCINNASYSINMDDSDNIQNLFHELAQELKNNKTVQK